MGRTMWTLSARSAHKLAGCDLDIQRWVRQLLRGPVDLTVITGKRPPTEQADAYAQGLSQARPGESPHNVEPLAFATDIMPYYREVEGGIDWRGMKELAEAIQRGDGQAVEDIVEVIKRRNYFIGYAMGVADSMGLDLVNGQDWDKDGRFNEHDFQDSPHWQYRLWKQMAGRV